MDFKDYYATLGVAKTASEKELKQAYRKLARKHHPDVNQGDKAAESRFKELNEAYEVLGDPAKRKKYDDLGANWRNYEQAGPGGPGFGGQPGGAYNVNVGGQPGGFRTMTPEEMREMFGEGDPFSDFFHTFFGGSAGPDDRAGRGRAGGGADGHAPGKGATSNTRSNLGWKTFSTAPRAGCRSTWEAHSARWTSGFRRASETGRAFASPAKAKRARAARLRETCTFASA